MKKRTILTLMVVMMLTIACVLVLASCGGSNDATSNNNNDSIVDNDNKSDTTNDNNNADNGGNKAEHHYGNWELITLPTATKEGSIKRTCTDEGCGAVETLVLPIINSDNYTSNVITAPTCTTVGVTKYTLINDKISYSFEVPELAAHDYVMKYDDNNHFEECSQCGTIRNLHKHEYTNSNKCDKCDYVSSECFEIVENKDNTYGIKSFDNANYSSFVNVVIPSEYNNKPVTDIKDSTFIHNKQLKSISIPSSIKNIGNYSFFGCTGLEKVNITDLSAWCKIPFGYGYNPLFFAHNLYLNDELVIDLVIPNDVTSIGDYAFDSCSAIKSVSIPSSVKSIGQRAFYNCAGITSINIPNGVESIGQSAFEGCAGLTNITIPSSVTSISSEVLLGCSSVANIAIDTNNSNYSSMGNCIVDKNTNTLIAGCKNSVIPNNVTSIYKSSFYGCRGLKSINIPSSVLSIGEYAFNGCENLGEITMHNGLTSIGGGAFLNCSELREVVVPDSVTNIGINAFEYCIKLDNITLPSKLVNILSNTFHDCKSLISVVVPDGVTQIEGSAFAGCIKLSSVELPQSVNAIGMGVFSECTSLGNIKVDVNNAKYKSEGNCIVDKDTNTLIVGCKNTVIPSGVTAIGAYAFNGCASLTNITLPSSIVSIDNYAFDNCTGLTSIIIPKSVTTIDGYVFRGCTNLTIYIEATSKPDGWSSMWNQDNCPVVWGYVAN